MRTDLVQRAAAASIVAIVLAAVPPTAALSAGLGETCGGIVGTTCDGGLWCDRQVGMCGVDDAQGKCIKIPAFCIAEHNPVCGCDKKTYGNDCERERARIAKDHNGECK